MIIVYGYVICNNINIIDIEKEEIPINDIVDYIISPPEEKEEIKLEESGQIIFCVDISGSMCITRSIKR